MKRKKEFLNFYIAQSNTAKPIQPLSDRDGLSMAYKRKNGIHIHGDTAYIAGTKSLTDAWDDLKIPFHATRYSQRYRDAEKYIANPTLGVKHVVGHSLGAAVSLELEKNHPHLKSTTYAAPTISVPWKRNTRYRNQLDPISILDQGASNVSDMVSLNPLESHSYENFNNTSGGSGGWVIGDTSKNTPWNPATSAFTTPPITQADLPA